MQHLLKLLNDDGYETSYRKDEASDVVKDIFWAHPTSIKLLNSFGIVLIMDNTYKTNRYHWPLLEIVGQTSTEKTFTAAFCYMEAEKQSNFIWALQQLKRVEGAHASLKKMLTDSKVDMCNAFESMQKLLTFQISAITESFQTSILKVDHSVNVSLYKELWGFVSHAALNYVADEVDVLSKVGCGKCDCRIRITHGLPCRCELARYTDPGKCIPLSLFHDHWRRLSFQDNDYTKDSSEDFNPQPLIVEFLRQLESSDVAGKKRLLKNFRLLLYPETTSMMQPKEKAKTKGRPIDRTTKRDLSEWEHQDAESDRLSQLEMSQSSQKVSQSKLSQLNLSQSKGCRLSQSEAALSKKSKRRSPHIQKFPIELQDHIEDIGDVIGDNNCGFRAIAMYKFGSEEYHMLIRQELINEMTTHKDLYVSMLFDTRYTEVKKSLYLDKPGLTPINKWLTLPDIGHVIVNKYNVVLVSLGEKYENCTTYLPYILRPPAEPKIWVIGFVNNCHWVQVFLEKQAPLPRINLSWPHFRSDAAAAWKSIIDERVAKYEKILSIHK